MYTLDSIADIQSNPDRRNIAVNRVGIRRLKHPIMFEEYLSNGNLDQQAVVATFDMYVNLPENVKGTHMSRFIALLNEQAVTLSAKSLPYWLKEMVKRLDATQGYLHATFSYFMQKHAPVSKAASLMDYEVSLEGHYNNDHCNILVTVVVPVTSLCPCSKEISKYGAHNQRSHVTAILLVEPHFSLTNIIKLIEAKASCELYGILKRTDEKAVTERAYENPKFVEDMVRDVATAFEELDTIRGYKITSENFESIHNHSAFAEIDRLWVAKPLKKSAIMKEQAAIESDLS